ncbi:hypothetical protein C0966_16670 [Bacillus methanolicus]|nr:hypothetical protein [Bacillus methanolicus]
MFKLILSVLNPVLLRPLGRFYGIIQLFRGIIGVFRGIHSIFDGIMRDFRGIHSIFDGIMRDFRGIHSNFRGINKLNNSLQNKPHVKKEFETEFF